MSRSRCGQPSVADPRSIITTPGGRSPALTIFAVTSPTQISPAVASNPSAASRGTNQAAARGRWELVIGPLPSSLARPPHRRAVRVLDGWGTGREPKSVAFPHLTGRTVVILMSAFAATTDHSRRER
jgi:hypothetical protein